MNTATDQQQLLIEELLVKYDEYLEMAADKAPLLMIDILSKLVIKERSHIEYLERRLYARDHG